jgi:hypothetical protein
MNKQQVSELQMTQVVSIMNALGYEANVWRTAPTFEVGGTREGNRAEYHHDVHHIILGETAMAQGLSTSFAHEITHSLQFFNKPSKLYELSQRVEKPTLLDEKVAYILDRYEVEARMVEVVVKYKLDAEGIKHLRRVYRSDWVIGFLTIFKSEIDLVKVAKFPTWLVKIRLKMYLAMRCIQSKYNVEALRLLTKMIYVEMGW